MFMAGAGGDVITRIIQTTDKAMHADSQHAYHGYGAGDLQKEA